MAVGGECRERKAEGDLGVVVRGGRQLATIVRRQRCIHPLGDAVDRIDSIQLIVLCQGEHVLPALHECDTGGGSSVRSEMSSSEEMLATGRCDQVAAMGSREVRPRVGLL